MDGGAAPTSLDPPAPADEPVSAMLARRVMAALAAGLASGALDGALSWWRSPRAELAARDLWPLMAFGAATLAPTLAALAALHVLLARAAAARGALRRAGGFLRAGPGQWFARDESAALRAAMAVMAALVAAGVG